MSEVNLSKIEKMIYQIRSHKISVQDRDILRSQFAILNSSRGPRKYLPFVHTGNGVAMLLRKLIIEEINKCPISLILLSLSFLL